jgi:hypothetical protein
MGESGEGAENNLEEAKVMRDLNIWSYELWCFRFWTLSTIDDNMETNTQKFAGNSPTLFSNPFACLSQHLLFIQFWKLLVLWFSCMLSVIRVVPSSLALSQAVNTFLLDWHIFFKKKRCKAQHLILLFFSPRSYLQGTGRSVHRYPFHFLISRKNTR